MRCRNFLTISLSSSTYSLIACRASSNRDLLPFSREPFELSLFGSGMPTWTHYLCASSLILVNGTGSDGKGRCMAVGFARCGTGKPQLVTSHQQVIRARWLMDDPLIMTNSVPNWASFASAFAKLREGAIDIHLHAEACRPSTLAQ